MLSDSAFGSNSYAIVWPKFTELQRSLIGNWGYESNRIHNIALKFLEEFHNKNNKIPDKSYLLNHLDYEISNAVLTEYVPYSVIVNKILYLHTIFSESIRRDKKGPKFIEENKSEFSIFFSNNVWVNDNKLSFGEFVPILIESEFVVPNRNYISVNIESKDDICFCAIRFY